MRQGQRRVAKVKVVMVAVRVSRDCTTTAQHKEVKMMAAELVDRIG